MQFINTAGAERAYTHDAHAGCAQQRATHCVTSSDASGDASRSSPGRSPDAGGDDDVHAPGGTNVPVKRYG